MLPGLAVHVRDKKTQLGFTAGFRCGAGPDRNGTERNETERNGTERNGTNGRTKRFIYIVNLLGGWLPDDKSVQHD